MIKFAKYNQFFKECLVLGLILYILIHTIYDNIKSFVIKTNFTYGQFDSIGLSSINHTIDR